MSRVFSVEVPIIGTVGVCIEAESKEEAVKMLKKGIYDDYFDVNWDVEEENFKALTVDDLNE
jgi:hypothetical protein